LIAAKLISSQNFFVKTERATKITRRFGKNHSDWHFFHRSSNLEENVNAMKYKDFVPGMLLLFSFSLLSGQPALLSQKEGGDLLYMIEEERLIHDILTSASYNWDIRLFDRLAEAEQAHVDKLVDVACEFSWTIPVPYMVNRPGQYENKAIQDLYYDLCSRTEESVEEALLVSALVYELNILDLDRRMLATDQQDLQTVYAHFKRTSQNYLRSLVSHLRIIGIEYQPVLLYPDEFDWIIQGEDGGKVGK
jgi:hypothetical protein